MRRSKVLGCMLGGAVGDALGYPVEFMKYRDITKKYGEPGITNYALEHGRALISDDTQMTMFTACGLLFAQTRGKMRGISGGPEGYIFEAYKEWLLTQGRGKKHPSGYQMTWLLNLPEMHHCRAPGNTCLEALSGGVMGTPDAPINASKGCGGIMRVAPVALMLDPAHMPQRDIDMLGAQTAAITHGHPLGYIPAAALTHIISKIVYKKAP